MRYAPILIPTLNRAGHLKRCLNSLRENTGVENTELYISVDYPPAEKYKAGHAELTAMLREMDLSCFREVHLYFQEKNLGAMENTEFLYRQAEKKFDTYIYTEDDNEFAPNFLEYMNQGLEAFENDPKVLAICGAKDAQWVSDGKPVVYTKLFAAYGLGGWVKKRHETNKAVPAKLVSGSVPDFRTIAKLYKQNACLFCSYVDGILCADRGFFWMPDGSLRMCDSVYSIYMHLTDMVCIAPMVAKSRTWGNDGSGENMPSLDLDVEALWPLDRQKEFSYGDTAQLRYLEENYAIGNAYLPSSRKRILLSWAMYGVLLLLGKRRDRGLAFLNKLRKSRKRVG